jgi:cobalt-zinc-cadmium efflux system membrane fusion protein
MGDSVMSLRTKRTFRVAVTIVAALAAACGTSPAPAPPELPSLDVTSWTDKTELFMEHPPLVAAQTVRFAVHLTRLADFSALTTGRPHIEMTPEAGGAPVTLPGSEALRPGAFRVDGTLPPAGRYTWALVVDAPGLADRHELGVTTVFADQAAGVADAEKPPEDDPSAISYLKEQQWTNEFATVLVRDADVRASFRVPAQIQPVTGGEAIVGAPAAGRFAAETLMSIGATVRAGQALGRIEPRLTTGDDRATLAAEAAEAQAATDAARAEQARAERLLADRAVPARRLEDARRAVTVAEARLRAAEARLAQRDETLRTGGGAAAGNAFVLRAPIAGRVAEVMATLGASYQEGAPLFRIVKTDEVELQALVPAADVARIRNVASVSLETPGSPDLLPLRLHHQHDSGVMDAVTRALAVQFRVDNPGGRLLIGQSGTAVLFTKDTLRVPVVPKEAVLMEAGRPFVFVQTGGETFARRFTEVAARDGDVVGLRGGVKPGERVVVRGAYDVQLASAARGLAAEGHVH